MTTDVVTFYKKWISRFAAVYPFSSRAVHPLQTCITPTRAPALLVAMPSNEQRRLYAARNTPSSQCERFPRFGKLMVTGMLDRVTAFAKTQGCAHAKINSVLRRSYVVPLVHKFPCRNCFATPGWGFLYFIFHHHRTIAFL